MMKSQLALCLLFSAIIASGQDSGVAIQTGQTTLEEYNYLTKGYHIQVESGLDMKKGYTLDSIGSYVIGDYNFYVLKLVRQANQELAGTLIITEGRVSGNKYYAAIPVNNSALMQLHHNDISKWPKYMLLDYCQLLALYVSEYVMTNHLIAKE